MEDRYLFKAKNKENNNTGYKELDWIIGNLVVEQSTGRHFIIDLSHFDENTKLCDVMVEVDPSTICQCTGLSDKTGEIIFKNDIVDFLGHRGIVKFECGSFGIAYEKHIDWDEIQANIMPLTGCENTLYACENDNYISLWEIYWNFNDEDDSLSTVEVIGNIFDNPELLEV
jgi:uncharacterized phage protein (TIGR01671 family)